jgi:hypothetical protein
VHIITFGNRTGKTEFLAEFLCGVVKGHKYVNQEFFKLPIFNQLKEKRLDGKLTVWWVCDGEMMKQNGPDYKVIKRHIPDAAFKAKTGNGVFREIHIPVLGKNDVPVVIVVSVKTHDMDVLSYAGDNVDVVICDEPLPQDKWAELSGRMVNLAGEVGGRVIIGATPLKLSGYLFDMIEDDDDTGRIAHDEGSIWENCAGNEVPGEQASRLGLKPDGNGGYITRGHLSREGIENAIENWKKSGDPDEVLARVDGKFTHIQGRIYKSFFPQAHVVNDYKIPESYPVVQVVDPHDARPDAAGWYAISPRNQWICIAEYPRRNYEAITSRTETIAQICEVWRDIENSFKGQVVLRIGDPNKFNDPDPATNLRLKQLYSQHGFDFDTNVIDNLDFGHEKVRQALYFDKEKFLAYPDEPMYRPKFVFFGSCRNHIKYMQNYTLRKWRDPSKAMPTKVDEAWKDFADIVRYFCVKMESGWNFSTLKAQMDGTSRDWEAIQAARNPKPSNLGSFASIGRGVYYGPRIPIPS